MAEHNSIQEAQVVANGKFNLPPAGGKGMWRREFIAPVGGVAADDLINFGTILPGVMFNPAAAKIHWDVGTATADLDLGHTGFSNIGPDGVVANIAADVDEFLDAADLASATLIGVAALNARAGGIYVSDRNVAGDKLDGLFVQGKVLVAGMPAGQIIILEFPIWTA